MSRKCATWPVLTRPVLTWRSPLSVGKKFQNHLEKYMAEHVMLTVLWTRRSGVLDPTGHLLTYYLVTLKYPLRHSSDTCRTSTISRGWGSWLLLQFLGGEHVQFTNFTVVQDIVAFGHKIEGHRPPPSVFFISFCVKENWHELLAFQSVGVWAVDRQWRYWPL